MRPVALPYARQYCLRPTPPEPHKGVQSLPAVGKEGLARLSTDAWASSLRLVTMKARLVGGRGPRVSDHQTKRTKRRPAPGVSTRFPLLHRASGCLVFLVAMFRGMQDCTQMASRAAHVVTSDACGLHDKIMAR